MCEQRGAILASIHSDEETQAIVNIASTVTSSAMFIGLSSNGFSMFFVYMFFRFTPFLDCIYFVTLASTQYYHK